ncbi:MAG TPA: DUF72 domain-containing protein [Chloroflexota bacterium]|jgi:uncharacterized protein YecE (DUF72 family)|nr:DUF72 domain-containing protein [Chloroflexota bacterium]
MARLYAGTSGWSYAPWKGKFYPADTKPENMLAEYAKRLNGVEINSTFRHMPAIGAFAKWKAAVPDGFRFAVKAPAAITHMRRLEDTEVSVIRLVERLNMLGDACGPLLVQLPDDMQLDVPRLANFLEFLRPFKRLTAVEFRHESWLDERAFELLRQFDVALCLTETDESTTPLLPSSTFAYLRLRKTEYSPEEMAGWRQQVQTLLDGGRDVYAFFRHEDDAAGPAYALQLLDQQAA